MAGRRGFCLEAGRILRWLPRVAGVHGNCTVRSWDNMCSSRAWNTGFNVWDTAEFMTIITQSYRDALNAADNSKLSTAFLYVTSAQHGIR